MAHHEGQHLVVMGHKLADMLLKQQGWSRRAEGALRVIQSQISTAGGYRQVSEQIEIQPVISYERRPGPPVVHAVPLGAFGDSYRTQRSRFICESHHDARFYQEVSEQHLSRAYPRSRLQLEFIYGGGGNSVAQWQEAMNLHPRPVIGIVDSDKTAPDAPFPPNATAERVVAVHQPGGVRCLMVLNCHEVENLLPQALVRQTYTVIQWYRKNSWTTSMKSEPQAIPT